MKCVSNIKRRIDELELMKRGVRVRAGLSGDGDVVGLKSFDLFEYLLLDARVKELKWVID